MHQISLENIDKAYPETPVLSGISLGISAGQRIGIIGRNGSGKSTLLRIIAGSEEPDSGEIVRSVGLTVTAMWQDPAFSPDATLSQVTDGKRRAIALADRLGLTDPDASVANLSGGQRKRLALALALSADTDILILDEPTNHLDLETKEMLIESLAGFEGSMLFVSHDREFLRGLSNRVLDLQPEDSTDGPDRYRGGYVEWVEATGQDAPGVHR